MANGTEKMEYTTQELRAIASYILQKQFQFQHALDTTRRMLAVYQSDGVLAQADYYRHAVGACKKMLHDLPSIRGIETEANRANGA